MRRVLAGTVAAGVALLAGLVLAGEPVDWSKAFERRTNDFDWSRVSNRTSELPGGPVDWSQAFPAKAQARPAAPEPAALPTITPAGEGRGVKIPAAPALPAEVSARPDPAPAEPAPADAAAAPPLAAPALPSSTPVEAAPAVVSPAPTRESSPSAAPSAPPAPAGKSPAPVQVATAEPRPGPLFPARGFGDAQVAHFLAAAMPVSSDTSRPRLLTRWQGDIRLRVAGRGCDAVVALVRDAAGEVAAALDGGRISLAEAEPANLLVFVLPDGPGDAPGYVQNAYDGAAVQGSRVVVYAGRVGRAGRGALLRLLLAALGLPGPAPAGADSVLAASARSADRLTALDRSALSLLYNPVVAPGMDPTSARQAVDSLR